jgi:hypothetical protein
MHAARSHAEARLPLPLFQFLLALFRLSLSFAKRVLWGSDTRLRL